MSKLRGEIRKPESIFGRGHKLPLLYVMLELVVASTIQVAVSAQTLPATMIANCAVGIVFTATMLSLDGYNFEKHYALFQQAGLVAVVEIVLLVFQLIMLGFSATETTMAQAGFATTVRWLVIVAGRKLYLQRRQSIVGKHVVAVLGDGWLARALEKELLEREPMGFVYAGAVVAADSMAKRMRKPLGSDESLESLIIERGITIIADARVDEITLASGRRETVLGLTAPEGARSVGLCDGQDLFEAMTRRVPIPEAGEMVAAELLSSKRPRKLHDIVGATANVIAACTILLLTLPVWLAVLIAIKLDDHGEVFFRQQRRGYKGREFEILKFRTMRPVDKAHGEVPNSDEDKMRVTRVGRILRKFRVDELPQLLNVLKRDLNIVGPRPFILAEADAFERDIPLFEFRHLVRPGITGLAQVSHGYRNSTSEARMKLGYDLYYVKNGGYFLTTMIILWSVVTVLIGRGE